MKPKFQPRPSSISAPKKFVKRDPGHGDRPGAGQDGQAERHDPLGPEAGDQVAGEERGRIHRQHMRGHDVGRIRLV